eukprot:3800145-Alexandrium_andersonii.AAC.1
MPALRHRRWPLRGAPLVTLVTFSVRSALLAIGERRPLGTAEAAKWLLRGVRYHATGGPPE